MADSQATNSFRPFDLVEEEQWKHHKKARLQHVMVPSKEVEEVDLAKYPSMWSCMYRASECYNSVLSPVDSNRYSYQEA